MSPKARSALGEYLGVTGTLFWRQKPHLQRRLGMEGSLSLPFAPPTPPQHRDTDRKLLGSVGVIGSPQGISSSRPRQVGSPSGTTMSPAPSPHFHCYLLATSSLAWTIAPSQSRIHTVARMIFKKYKSGPGSVAQLVGGYHPVFRKVARCIASQGICPRCWFDY